MSLCAEIQSAVDAGNIRGLFEGIKRAIGPTQLKCVPLKTSTVESIAYKSKLILCWPEHHSELYGGTSFVSHSALDKIERLLTLFELDDVPSKEEL